MESSDWGRALFPPRLALAGFLWLALFSVLYTLGDEIGAWPKPPAGAFHNVDLVVGLAAGATLLAVLLRSPVGLRTEN